MSRRLRPVRHEHRNIRLERSTNPNPTKMKSDRPERLTELLKDPNPARARRAMEAMMTMVKIDIAALEKAAG
jgi:hypothetical protein